MVSCQIIEGAFTQDRFKNFIQVARGRTILQHRDLLEVFRLFGKERDHTKSEDEVPGILTNKGLPKRSPFFTMVENAVSCIKTESKKQLNQRGSDFMVDRAPGWNTSGL